MPTNVKKGLLFLSLWGRDRVARIWALIWILFVVTLVVGAVGSPVPGITPSVWDATELILCFLGTMWFSVQAYREYAYFHRQRWIQDKISRAVVTQNLQCPQCHRFGLNLYYSLKRIESTGSDRMWLVCPQCKLKTEALFYVGHFAPVDTDSFQWSRLEEGCSVRST